MKARNRFRSDVRHEYERAETTVTPAGKLKSPSLTHQIKAVRLQSRILVNNLCSFWLGRQWLTSPEARRDAIGFTIVAVFSILSWLIAWGLYIYAHSAPEP